MTAPAATQGIVCVGATNVSQLVGDVFAVDTNKGSLRWRFVTGGGSGQETLARAGGMRGPEQPLSSGPLVFAPAALAGMLYLRAESRVYALLADTGQKQWVAEPGAANFDGWVVG